MCVCPKPLSRIVYVWYINIKYKRKWDVLFGVSITIAVCVFVCVIGTPRRTKFILKYNKKQKIYKKEIIKKQREEGIKKKEEGQKKKLIIKNIKI